ncbi:hypothetical protein [Ectothiorhodospira mobilis]|uniref:hypothetical protein n=1 Tax=Ectothiorhodospira mobilis TaxID=195064 RepID=UPI001EE9011A|nr:hypothetical protein [Ectothiorhodospira mobilis]MCG5536325.1 hypothetical protein [Ectothiorhodospira mobilis]
MTLLKQARLNGRDYQLHYFTGTVVDEKKWSETEVTGSGGGGGGYSVAGTGQTAPSYSSVTSRTTRHDQIILKNQEGQERSFSFQDWNIQCRKGNTLTVVWAIPAGRDKGPYVLAYNHETEQSFMDETLSRMFMPGRFTVPVLGGNSSWWPYAAILGAPLAWSLLWWILPGGGGMLFGLGLLLSPFAGFFGVRALARSLGQKKAEAYLHSDPLRMMDALRGTRGEAAMPQQA